MREKGDADLTKKKGKYLKTFEQHKKGVHLTKWGKDLTTTFGSVHGEIATCLKKLLVH